MKHRMAGFQKPLRADPVQVGLAVVTYQDTAAVCSCGWVVRAHREKVREDSIDRHFNRKHNGRGLRL